jgi:hypothetical protein
MTSLQTPIFFYFSNEKHYFCPHIAESATIAKSSQYRRNFLAKNFRRYWASPCIKLSIKKILKSYQLKFFEKIKNLKLNHRQFLKRFFSFLSGS